MEFVVDTRNFYQQSKSEDIKRKFRSSKNTKKYCSPAKLNTKRSIDIQTTLSYLRKSSRHLIVTPIADYSIVITKLSQFNSSGCSRFFNCKMTTNSDERKCQR